MFPEIVGFLDVIKKTLKYIAQLLNNNNNEIYCVQCSGAPQLIKVSCQVQCQEHEQFTVVICMYMCACVRMYAESGIRYSVGGLQKAWRL